MLAEYQQIYIRPGCVAYGIEVVYNTIMRMHISRYHKTKGSVKVQNKKTNRKITLECQMVAYLAQNLAKKFRTNVFVKELSIGYGVADLVFAKGYDSSSMSRKPIDNYSALVLYLCLQNGEPISVEGASGILGISRRSAACAIEELVGAYYLVQNKEGLYCKTLARSFKPLNLIAVEAKIKNWRQGIIQARRYKAFTDQSYLAILLRYAKNVDFQLLELHDVGLITIDEESGLTKIIRKPVGLRPKHMDKKENSYFANELFLARAAAV